MDTWQLEVSHVFLSEVISMLLQNNDTHQHINAVKDIFDSMYFQVV